MVEIPDRPLAPERRGSFGIPVPGAKHRIADPVSGATLPSGEPGEIQVRGPILMDRIYKQERHETFTADGWYPTGDHGWFDADGHLHFTGRASSVIKVAGSNVAPAEVEAVLAQLPGVLHSFVLGLPHPVRGQVVGAVIVPRHGTELTAADITGYARANLSSYKVPTLIRLLAEDKLPMLPTGRADCEALTRLLADG
jgi:acyl-CoA synthetase (AMP-forming)/AMP-acid ligase II